MTHLNELLDRIDALKEKLDARRPLTGTERHQLREYYRIGLTYASNALEGNTLDNAPFKELIAGVVLEAQKEYMRLLA